MSRKASEIRVRATRSEDFDAIIELCRTVYPFSQPWDHTQLASHLAVFPEGQLTATEIDAEGKKEKVVGMAASLILAWDDYDHQDSWRDFTDHGMFTNHDPQGRTLYAAEVMVHPDCQGEGVGSKIYEARRELARQFGLRRIRAGSRLRGYHRWAGRLTAAEYVEQVVTDEIRDPTLSFQLHRGFRVIDVVSGYLPNDPDSLGWAAVIEWLNPDAP